MERYMGPLTDKVAEENMRCPEATLIAGLVSQLSKKTLSPE
jgi:hypothetical protein